MKINTKKCTPIKDAPDSLIHPNKFILSPTTNGTDKESSSDNKIIPCEVKSDEEAAEMSKSNGGREVKYLPQLIHTPVLTSKRECKSERRLISFDDIEELNNQLDKLTLSKGRSGVKGEEVKDLQDDGKKEEGITETDKNVSNQSMLGRFYKSVLSYKTCKRTDVKRSARIAAAY